MADPRPPTPDPRLPLRHVRVVDFSWIVAGPQATRILADLGADVIRVEYPGRIDSVRMGNPMPDAPAGSVDHSGMFSNFNRNKRSATLNVMHPDGMALLHDLLRVSDVVIENFSPRVLEGWGLTYEAMAAINPAIIYISYAVFCLKKKNIRALDFSGGNAAHIHVAVAPLAICLTLGKRAGSPRDSMNQQNPTLVS